MQGRKRRRRWPRARKVASKVPADFREDNWALYQTLLSQPLYTLARFGQWEAILAEPLPAEPCASTAAWRTGRAASPTRTPGARTTRARSSLALARIQEDPKTPEVLVGMTNATTLLTIAREVLAGELAARERRFDEAIAHLDRAVRLEDSLAYGEPPDWYYPTRHNLGAALLDAGRAQEAEVVYWQDLRRYRDNAFALIGLAQSLKAQGRRRKRRRRSAATGHLVGATRRYLVPLLTWRTDGAPREAGGSARRDRSDAYSLDATRARREPRTTSGPGRIQRPLRRCTRRPWPRP